MNKPKNIFLFFLAIFFTGLFVFLLDKMSAPNLEKQPDFQAYSRKQLFIDLDKIK